MAHNSDRGSDLKEDVEHFDPSAVPYAVQAEYQEYLKLDQEFTGERKKKLLRSMDLRVLSVLTLLYLVAYVDRSNIGNAALFGLKTDLKISNTEYNNILMWFFFTYAFCDIPSAILLKRIGPTLYLGIAMTGFGLITMCTAFCKTKYDLIVCRVLLGVFESGVFPGVNYILSTWYSRYELQTRISIFYAGASASGAFAGLLAYAIANLDHVHGYRAWRWIFGIEGLGTTIFGLLMFLLVSDTPAKSKWLKDDERRYLVLRLKYSNGPVPNKQEFDWKYVWQALKDWKGWLGCVLFWGTAIPVYGMSYTLPTIMKNLGFSAARAQGVTAPPYIFAALSCICVSILSDKYKKRSLALIGSFSVAIIGYIILITAAGHPHVTGVSLFGVFVTAAGLYSATPPMMAWFANNIEGQTKRAVSLAIVPTVGQLGGLVGSHIFIATEAPFYHTGFGVSMAVCFACGILPTVVMRFALQIINKRRDKISEEEVRAKYTEAELAEMGDKSPLFRYIL
ncbi:MFS general substrate transporter [Meredithblackwellia eburnea MCA 4105]